MAKYALLGGCLIIFVIILILVFTNRYIQFRIKRRIFKLKNGNITREENMLINIYVNYHYPVQLNYKGYCIECQTFISSEENIRCPVCGCYICNVCNTCHPRCNDRDRQIIIAETFVKGILNGDSKKKIKAIQYRITEQKKLPAGKKYICKAIDSGSSPVQEQ